MPYEIETIRINSAHLGDDMSQRQRSPRLSRILDRLSKRKRAAKQAAAKEARNEDKHGRQQDQASANTAEDVKN
ncbi:hypothetical protein DWF00_14630 [Bosea caraganae]|uniref:Uncharacterized protein n=2 Tax=Bosea caraganae TaxID=2763117 RepID=A0A370KYJ7_9HYPH|nr:hypothetical protein DWE98_26515 [Bosea caraganae]RDJ25644.1 hypothetical protein DWF00_14630 [Bosea caraganae]